MKIVIGSEGMGSWSEKYISFILNKIGYKTIEWKNSMDCNIIVSSNCLNLEPIWYTFNKKRIYWTGEPNDIDLKQQTLNKKDYLAYLVNSIPKIFININIIKFLIKFIFKIYIDIYFYLYFYFYNERVKSPLILQPLVITPVSSSKNKNHLYVPYILFCPHLYKKRKYTNTNRKYFLAYCNSNKIKERETIFNLFIERKGINMCHSFGSCYGNYKQTKKPHIPGSWGGNELINTYKNYTFVIAMENTCKDGYVTEKILNALYSGAIPIYWGSKNINEFFNKNAFINVNDFKSFEECVDYVCNMSKEEIYKMANEEIYSNNEILNLFNDDLKNNKTLENHMSRFIEYLNN